MCLTDKFCTLHTLLHTSVETVNAPRCVSNVKGSSSGGNLFFTLCCVNLYCKILVKLLIREFPPVALRPNAGHVLVIDEVSRSHTKTHHSLQDSSRRVIGSSQRPLPDKTQSLKHPSRWRDQNPKSQQAASCLSPRGHQEWLTICIHSIICNEI